MNYQVLERASTYNNFVRSNVIANITERHQFNEHTNTFDTFITAVIKDDSGHFKTFKFPTDRALFNAIRELENTGNTNLRKLIKFTR
jgi:hypothetical protein